MGSDAADRRLGRIRADLAHSRLRSRDLIRAFARNGGQLGPTDPDPRTPKISFRKKFRIQNFYHGHTKRTFDAFEKRCTRNAFAKTFGPVSDDAHSRSRVFLNCGEDLTLESQIVFICAHLLDRVSRQRDYLPLGKAGFCQTKCRSVCTS